MRSEGWWCAGVALLLAACGSQPPRPGEEPAVSSKSTPEKPAYALKRGGGYYLDDGPGDNPPDNLDDIPDAQPRLEPLHRPSLKPYSVLGQDFKPMTELKPYKAKGIGSWYGRKFHGSRTATGETYDMYAMTAAHPTLPLPSYARVTNLANGKSVVVRVNDRGPFLHNRLIDLSYAAAYRLGYAGAGSALVEVELILPGAETPVAGARQAQPAELSRRAAAETAAATTAEPIARTATVQDAEPANLPTVAEARGTFLQLAAFASSDNAESFRLRIAQQLAGIADNLHIHAKDGMFRLHVGPYRDAQEARSVARRIRDSLELQAIVVQR